MTQTMVGSFFAKALETKPRFFLSARTGVLTRYSGLDYVPWEEVSPILHVNLSGIAIAIPEDLAPVIGEWIGLEVPLELNIDPMLYFGKVVHIQELSGNHKGVVIQFLSPHLSEKFEISRAFSSLLNDKKNGSSELSQDFDKFGRQKKLLKAMAVFWLVAVAVILWGLIKPL